MKYSHEIIPMMIFFDAHILEHAMILLRYELLASFRLLHVFKAWVHAS